ncbi:hypothetical protein Vadar_029836 [Vaccinium darrowii]|uniref:Uncharacterized protein n=1 Tax=Vaccinium darrowii TaxID=229202 RepID=A0ACB7YSS6_9ERIC|nr:hypothetical protein Vadar_029836 [Vaccinium darrowii]
MNGRGTWVNEWLETQVPLLLELQVKESKYVFEAKTVERMELLVLSALEWKMNPVTPLLFIPTPVGNSD